MIFDFDPTARGSLSGRYPVYAENGMVCCSEPHAAAAGLEILRRGGNAVDAAVAAAACLTVTEPTSNGIGGDAFAIVWSEKDRKLFGLNSSGPAPLLASAERVIGDGKAAAGRMPRFGWTPVTVPGAPKAWAALTQRFGRNTLAENLSQAVSYARYGYPLAPVIAGNWKKGFEAYRERFTSPEFSCWFDTFAPGGFVPGPGDRVVFPCHADTLEMIGDTDADAFYRGRLAERIDAESRAFGGYLRAEDLAAFEAEWVEPLRIDYRGYEVCELPPNGQGIVALMALNILRNFEPGDVFSDDECHRKIEAVKAAFSDALAVVTDPRFTDKDWTEYLTADYGTSRAAEIGDRAKVYAPYAPLGSGTVYLACADGEGNMVSYIQSNYNGFGSGIVIRDTGIALQNRGADFSLDPKAANFLMPGKRSYHTIIPGFLMKDGLPLGPFGVMGGYMQPQGHVQVITDLIDHGMNPQQALDTPRWQWMRDGSVTAENGFSADLAGALKAKGHAVSFDQNTGSFGRGQIILRLDNGMLAGGTESRADSSIACW